MTGRDDTRTVHARYDGMEIVRYDRAGKWYLEPTRPSLKRQHVSIMEAAQAAHWGIENANGIWIPRLRGGGTFDAIMGR